MTSKPTTVYGNLFGNNTSNTTITLFSIDNKFLSSCISSEKGKYQLDITNKLNDNEFGLLGVDNILVLFKAKEDTPLIKVDMYVFKKGMTHTCCLMEV